MAKIEKSDELLQILKEFEDAKKGIDEAYINTRISVSRFNDALDKISKKTNTALISTAINFRGIKSDD